MKGARFSCIGVAVLATLGWQAARAEIPQGTYAIARDHRAEIEAAIDVSVAKMNALIRSIARKRLRDDNVAYERVRILRSATDIEITFDDRKPIRMPVDGAPVQVVNEHGDKSAVTAQTEPARLVQTYKGRDGTRVNTFRWDAEKAVLYLDVHTSSPRLPQPVQYTLEYRPAS